MHPLSGDLSELKEADLESKISDLTKKYFLASNLDMKNQIASLLDDYNAELRKRRDEQLKKMMETRDKSLDKLIKID
jgi:hypothetical protein